MVSREGGCEGGKDWRKGEGVKAGWRVGRREVVMVGGRQ